MTRRTSFDDPVTHEQAMEALRRLIHSHFNEPDAARCSIPANPNDDDLLLSDYIKQQRAKETTQCQVTQ